MQGEFVLWSESNRKPAWRKFAPLISWLLPSQNADPFVNRSSNRLQTNASRSWWRTSLAVIASALSVVCLQIGEIEMCETNHCTKTIKREKEEKRDEKEDLHQSKPDQDENHG